MTNLIAVDPDELYKRKGQVREDLKNGGLYELFEKTTSNKYGLSIEGTCTLEAIVDCFGVYLSLSDKMQEMFMKDFEKRNLEEPREDVDFAFFNLYSMYAGVKELNQTMKRFTGAEYKEGVKYSGQDIDFNQDKFQIYKGEVLHRFKIGLRNSIAARVFTDCKKLKGYEREAAIKNNPSQTT